MAVRGGTMEGSVFHTFLVFDRGSPRSIIEVPRFASQLECTCPVMIAWFVLACSDAP
jgi:hypothetical protein